MSFKVNFESSQIIEKLCMNLEGKIKKIIQKIYVYIYKFRTKLKNF